jgi:hypothetical protein
MLMISFAMLLVINRSRPGAEGGTAMAPDTTTPAPAKVRVRNTEHRLARWTLIGLALVFLSLFPVLPLAAVFVGGLPQGPGEFCDRPAGSRNIFRDRI